MSFNLRNLREISNEPLNKFTNQLAKKLSRFLTKDQLDKLEDKEDIYSDGQDVETVVRLHNGLSSQTVFTFDKMFYPPTEPDGEFLTCWIRGRSLGNITSDISGFDNHASIIGDPVLVDGAPFNLGIRSQGTLSVARRMNRPTSDFENAEYLKVADHTSLQVTGIATGLSFFIRFKIFDIAQQNGKSRRLFEKIDDTTPNNGFQVRVNDTGQIIVIIKRGGSEYKKETDNGTITADPDTVYEVWITYAVSGNAIKVYVNNVDKTLSDFTGDTDWHSDLTDRTLNIFRRGAGSNSGYLYGDFYDFMEFRERVVDATGVSNHYTNKWTTANIPFGQVMITNYWATYSETPPASPSATSFTTDSFTSGSFTTT